MAPGAIPSLLSYTEPTSGAAAGRTVVRSATMYDAIQWSIMHYGGKKEKEE
jgi:hypothetical protein